ncbi:APC family permease [Neomicrococcus aestuarii]|uniref:DNA-binding protein n=1 Tax=Neomicrococcus aestuarii TaxID=556325 RepID=A0A1L2ZL91_9MICC|nr:APC family permease [Neomicrococcus aestuarii]APF39782.1 DNA-binding protein [Neomicrococcus aestuarii]
MLSFLDALKRAVVGQPFMTRRIPDKPMPKRLALPLLSANPLSSMAYAPDEIILTLAVAGLAALHVAPWVGVAVAVIMLLIILSYRESVKAYPSGGGDYEIAKTNIGPRAGIIVAAALMVDFVLTVAVSTSSAAHYIIAMFPALAGSQGIIAGCGVVILTLINLRGRGKNRTLASIPVILFVAALVVLIVVGSIRAATGTLERLASADFEVLPEAGFDSGLTGLLGVLVVLRAFSTGSAAMTGIEGPISNVHALKAPRARNARAILLMLGFTAAAISIGLMFLARAADIRVTEDPHQNLRLNGGPIPENYVQDPVLGQLAHAVFGLNSPLFYVLGVLTVLVLATAGHMAFRSFPNLASLLAHDGYLPRQLRRRGDRLGYSNGILALGLAALCLVVVFQAHLTSLIQLYVVGVFVSFTLSQLGMLRHWGRKARNTASKAARLRIARARILNLVGLIITATVLFVVLLTRLTLGAWLAIAAIAVLYLVMHSIHEHYEQVERELKIDDLQYSRALPSRVHALILVSSIRKPVLRAVASARASRPSRIEALVVDVDNVSTERTLQAWDKLDLPVPIRVLASPYRETTSPITDYIRSIRARYPRDLVVVYIPEYVVGHWWEQLVHNQTALRIKTRLHFEPGVVVASVPWQLQSSRELIAQYDDAAADSAESSVSAGSITPAPSAPSSKIPPKESHGS